MKWLAIGILIALAVTVGALAFWVHAVWKRFEAMKLVDFAVLVVIVIATGLFVAAWSLVARTG